MSGPTRDLGGGKYGNNNVDTSTDFADGTVTATATAIVLGPETPCIEVLVQSEPDNTAGVRVGTASSQSHYLEPGGQRAVPVTNVNLVYVKAISGSQRINWWARGG